MVNRRSALRLIFICQPASSASSGTFRLTIEWRPPRGGGAPEAPLELDCLDPNPSDLHKDVLSGRPETSLRIFAVLLLAAVNKEHRDGRSIALSDLASLPLWNADTDRNNHGSVLGYFYRDRATLPRILEKASRGRYKLSQSIEHALVPDLPTALRWLNLEPNEDASQPTAPGLAPPFQEHINLDPRPSASAADPSPDVPSAPMHDQTGSTTPSDLPEPVATESSASTEDAGATNRQPSAATGAGLATERRLSRVQPRLAEPTAAPPTTISDRARRRLLRYRAQWLVALALSVAGFGFTLYSAQIPVHLSTNEILTVQILSGFLLACATGRHLVATRLFPLYLPISKLTAFRHIRGRLRAMRYQPYEALPFYELVSTELDRAQHRSESDKQPAVNDNSATILDLQGILLQDRCAVHQMLNQHSEAFATARESQRRYEEMATRYPNERDVSQMGSSRAFASIVSARFYAGAFSGDVEGFGSDTAEAFLIKTLQLASPHDPLLLMRSNQSADAMIPPANLVFDPYGASKAHCQYSWCLLPEHPEKATWHADIALRYAKIIPGFTTGDLWGTRDGGPIGGAWRRLLAYFTLGDCYLLRGALERAEDYYRIPHFTDRQLRRINPRKEYFIGHWFWLFLLRTQRPHRLYGLSAQPPVRWLHQPKNIGTHNWRQARLLLEKTRAKADHDRYLYRLSLSELHLGDLWHYRAPACATAQDYWTRALETSRNSSPLVESQARFRLENQPAFDLLYPQTHDQASTSSPATR